MSIHPLTPDNQFADALVITGPTGSGKSAVALTLADRLNAEIVAMDSMTLYRGMDIGTAKPTPAEQQQVRHHLIDVLDPAESGSVARWLDLATVACAEIRQRGKRPLFVGGTPFYLKSLLHGLFESPPIPPHVRAELEAEAERIGPAALHARLAAVDAKTAARLHPNDVRRVVRALEIFTAIGTPISALQQTWDTPGRRIPAVVIDRPRDELNARIDARVDAMIAAGWLDEARRLRDRPLGKEASQALGYRELFDFLNGTTAWAETVAAIKLRTRQFAKRQRTWFRGLPDCRPATGPDFAEQAFRVLSTPAGVIN